jgi:hypothetical protein
VKGGSTGQSSAALATSALHIVLTVVMYLIPYYSCRNIPAATQFFVRLVELAGTSTWRGERAPRGDVDSVGGGAPQTFASGSDVGPSSTSSSSYGDAESHTDAKQGHEDIVREGEGAAAPPAGAPRGAAGDEL